MLKTLTIVVISLMLTACSLGPSPAEVETQLALAITETQLAQPTNTKTATPTRTPSPTRTPTPSRTATSTPTLTPTGTRTPTRTITPTRTETLPPVTQTALAKEAAKTATAEVIAMLAECANTKSTTIFLECFVIYANEFDHIVETASDYSAYQENELLGDLDDRLAALTVPPTGQSMHLYLRQSILSLQGTMLSLLMGDYDGASYYTSISGQYYGNYISTRVIYLASIGTTVKAAGFTR